MPEILRRRLEARQHDLRRARDPLPLLDDRPVHALEIEGGRHLLSGLVEQPLLADALGPLQCQRRDPREGLDGAQVLLAQRGLRPGRRHGQHAQPPARGRAHGAGDERGAPVPLPRRVGPLSLQARAQALRLRPVLDARDEQRSPALDRALGEARSRRVVGRVRIGASATATSSSANHSARGRMIRCSQSTAWNAHALRSRKRRSWWSISASVWCSHDSEDGPSSMPRTSRTVVASIIASVEVHDSR